MPNDNFYICRETLIKIGVDITEAIQYLECKKAADMNPAHVKALHNLKKWPTASSPR